MRWPFRWTPRQREYADLQGMIDALMFVAVLVGWVGDDNNTT